MALGNILHALEILFFMSYPYFFILGLTIFGIVIIKNKSFLNHIGFLFKKTHLITKILLVCLIIFHIFNSVYSMEPLNNLLHVSSEIIYQANQLYTKHTFSFVERPLSFSTLIAITKIFFSNIDYILIVSAWGILFSILSIIIIFLSVKHLTNDDVLSLIAIMFYVSIRDVVYYSTTWVTTTPLSSTIILFLAFLYITDSKKIINSNSILFCTVLSTYFRPENLALVIAFLCYFLINRLHARKHFKPSELMAAFLIFLPNTYFLLRYKWYTNSSPDFFVIGFEGIVTKSIEFYGYIIEKFTAVSLVFLVIGLVYMIKNKKYGVILIFFGVLSVYLGFQTYSQLHSHYLFNLAPLILVIIITGLYFSFDINLKIIKKYKLLFKYVIITTFIVLVVFNLDYNFFLKFEKSPGLVTPSINFGNSLKGSKIVLYGYRDLIFNYQRFYSNYTLVSPEMRMEKIEYPFNDDISSFDYIVHIAVVGSDELMMEEIFNTDVKMVNKSDDIFVYKVLK